MQLPDTSRHDAPDTFRGALESFRHTRSKFFCKTHGDLQAVASVHSIRQFEESATYDCVLECGCERMVSIAVSRTPIGKAKLKEKKQQAKEHQELLAAMESEQLL